MELSQQFYVLLLAGLGVLVLMTAWLPMLLRRLPCLFRSCASPRAQRCSRCRRSGPSRSIRRDFRSWWSD